MALVPPQPRECLRYRRLLRLDRLAVVCGTCGRAAHRHLPPLRIPRAPLRPHAVAARYRALKQPHRRSMHGRGRGARTPLAIERRGVRQCGCRRAAVAAAHPSARGPQVVHAVLQARHVARPGIGPERHDEERTEEHGGATRRVVIRLVVGAGRVTHHLAKARRDCLQHLGELLQCACRY